MELRKGEEFMSGRKRKHSVTTDDGRSKIPTFVAPRDVASTADIDISWFFFNNKYLYYKILKFEESTLKQRSYTFQSIFAKEIRAQYSFPADPDTISFHKPIEAYDTIPTTWNDTLPDICTVSSPILPGTSLYDGVGEDLQKKPTCIHLFVTAKIKTCVTWIIYSPKFFDHSTKPMEFSNREFEEPTFNHQSAFITEMKTYYRHCVDKSTVCFWKPKTNLSQIPVEWKITTPSIDTVATQISSQMSFSNLIGKDVRENPGSIHLFVTAKTITSTPGGFSISGFAPFRSYMELIEAKKYYSPSAGATPASYNNTQSMSTHKIYDGRRSEKSAIAPRAPPIYIYHSIFARFKQLLTDPQFRPTPDYLRKTCRFMSFLGNITTEDENVRNGHFRDHIQDLLMIDASPIENEDSTIPDGSFKTLVGCRSVAYGIIELRREMGAGSGDPSIQAGLSMLNCWRLRKNISHKCCCPTIMITGGGPWLCVMGGVITDKVIIQRLTDFVWMGLSSTQEQSHVYECSRVMNALRVTLTELEAYYAEDVPKAPELIPDKAHPRFFPFPVKYMVDQRETGFQYLAPLQTSQTCVTYKACRDEDKTEIVVKFVSKYGEDVHRFLAKHGWAPALHYYGPLPETTLVHTFSPAADNATPELGTSQRMHMVVMDYVPSTSYNKEDHHHLDDHLRQILTALHENGFVLGDLRPPNILVTPDNRLMLVDFDWSGRYDIRSQSNDPRIPEDVWERIKQKQTDRECESQEHVRYAHYPLEMSEKIQWASGALDLEPIRPEHDWEMFSKL